MPNINLINGIYCPKKISAKYFLSVEISRPKVKKNGGCEPIHHALKDVHVDVPENFGQASKHKTMHLLIIKHLYIY